MGLNGRNKIKMKVIIRETHEKLGEAGSIVNVAKGYARNFLIPKKIALEYSKSSLKILEEEKKIKEVRKNKEKRVAEQLGIQLNKVSLTASVRVGEEDRVFGTVTTQDIANLLKEKGFDIDKKKILLENPIKALGIYTIKIKLHSEVETSVKLWVVKE
jgi:large subunit ribosomal protein L9